MPGTRDRHATVVAYLALLVALSGSAYAVATVDSKDVVDGSLKSVDLEDNKGVTSADVRNDNSGGGLIGADIKEKTLDRGVNATFLGGKKRPHFAPRRGERWHEVGTAGEPGFHVNGWANVDDIHNTAAFFKTHDGVVHLKGRVRLNGAGTWCIGAIFTLPQAYRPARREVQPALKEGALFEIHVIPDTGYVAFPGCVNAGEWLSLDGVSFRAAKS
jgi:hypothetical protein